MSFAGGEHAVRTQAVGEEGGDGRGGGDGLRGKSRPQSGGGGGRQVFRRLKFAHGRPAGVGRGVMVAALFTLADFDSPGDGELGWAA